MKAESAATVICLSPSLVGCVEAAFALLRFGSRQECFRFEYAGVSDVLEKSSSRAPHSWSEVELVLAAERKRRGCEHLIAVLDEPIENNWFSRAAYGKNIAWITTNDWEFYSDVPATAFVAYELLSNLVQMLVDRK